MKSFLHSIILGGMALTLCSCGITPGDKNSSGVNATGGWGPERETFTMDKPASYVTFNSIIIPTLLSVFFIIKSNLPSPDSLFDLTIKFLLFKNIENNPSKYP